MPPFLRKRWVWITALFTAINSTGLWAVVQAVKELAEEVGVEAWDWQAPEEDTELAAKVEAAAKDGLVSAYAIADKMQRRDAIGAVGGVQSPVQGQQGESLGLEDLQDAGLQTTDLRRRVLPGPRRLGDSGAGVPRSGKHGDVVAGGDRACG